MNKVQREEENPTQNKPPQWHHKWKSLRHFWRESKKKYEETQRENEGAKEWKQYGKDNDEEHGQDTEAVHQRDCLGNDILSKRVIFPVKSTSHVDIFIFVANDHYFEKVSFLVEILSFLKEVHSVFEKC